MTKWNNGLLEPFRTIILLTIHYYQPFLTIIVKNGYKHLWTSIIKHFFSHSSPFVPSINHGYFTPLSGLRRRQPGRIAGASGSPATQGAKWNLHMGIGWTVFFHFKPQKGPEILGLYIGWESVGPNPTSGAPCQQMFGSCVRHVGLSCWAVSNTNVNWVDAQRIPFFSASNRVRQCSRLGRHDLGKCRGQTWRSWRTGI